MKAVSVGLGGKFFFLFSIPLNMKKSVSYLGPVKSFNLPSLLHFHFHSFSFTTQHFQGWLHFSVYHTKIFVLEEQSHLLPFCPRGFPFQIPTPTAWNAVKQHSLGLFLPGITISWQNTPGMERAVYFG